MQTQFQILQFQYSGDLLQCLTFIIFYLLASVQLALNRGRDEQTADTVAETAHSEGNKRTHCTLGTYVVQFVQC